MKSFLLLLSLVLASKAADKIRIERDGARWDVTVSGSLPVQNLVRIAAAGNLTVRGVNSQEIRYTIAARLRAADKTAALRIAQGYRVQNTAGQIIFDQPASIRVEVPHATPYLALMSAAGVVDAAGIDGSVRADSPAGQILLDRIGGDAEIHSGGGATVLGRIAGRVLCYSGGGSIRAVVIGGGGIFETHGGDIQLGEAMGSVRAVTAAGGIRIDHAGSQVFADTFGGPIDIGEAPSVECRSASGTIRLNNISGRVRAATGSGNIIAGILAGRALGDSLLSTRGGDITVFIPSNMGVTIEADTDGSHNWASIRSDFSGLRIMSRPSSLTARGTINGGGPKLRLTGSGGRIEIKRK